MLVGTELERACIVADTPQALSHAVETALNTPFDSAERARRVKLLERYAPQRNIELITRYLTEKTL